MDGLLGLLGNMFKMSFLQEMVSKDLDCNYYHEIVYMWYMCNSTHGKINVAADDSV